MLCRAIPLIVAVVCVLCAMPVAGQHYDDWYGFEFRTVMQDGDPSEFGFYELTQDYTVSLPDYFSEVDSMPADAHNYQEFYYNWASTSLPTCDWDFIRMEPGGILTVKKGFRWDGPSYPWRDHSYWNYRSSMVHDALYSLMRLNYHAADHNHNFMCEDVHSQSNAGDCNRWLADMMIYMIAVEDGQDIGGAQGANMDYQVIRYGGACKTHKDDLLERWCFHISNLAAYPGDGEVVLRWKAADYSHRDPNYDDHFQLLFGYSIYRNDDFLGMVTSDVTSYTDTSAVNGQSYKYRVVPHPGNSNPYDMTAEEYAFPVIGPGNCIELDGVDDYVDATLASADYVDGLPPMMHPNELTMEAWVCPEAKSGLQAIMSFHDGTQDKNTLYYHSDSSRFAYADDTTYYKYSPGDFDPDHWYHVAVTIDMANNATLWVDGTSQVAFTTPRRPDDGCRFSIGQEFDRWEMSDHFKGKIDEVRIWNVARSQPELLDNMYSPLFGDEDDLVGLWHFDEQDHISHNCVSCLDPTPHRKALDATANNSHGRVHATMYPLDTVFVPSGAMQEPTVVQGVAGPGGLPQSFVLEQNYPNPFNATTQIVFALPRSSQVTLEVFNVLGKRVTTLVNERLSPGNKVVTWDGRNDRGEDVASGIYFYRLRTDSEVATKKMMLLK